MVGAVAGAAVGAGLGVAGYAADKVGVSGVFKERLPTVTKGFTGVASGVGQAGVDVATGVSHVVAPVTTGVGTVVGAAGNVVNQGRLMHLFPMSSLAHLQSNYLPVSRCLRCW